MITIKNKRALEKMSTAGQHLSKMFKDLETVIKPGVSTLAVDTWIADRLKTDGLVSMSKGYRGYQHVSCISVNDEVVHGVPRPDRILKEGDVVKVDVCASWQGYAADMARCYILGSVSSQVRKLIEVAYTALDKGIEQVRAGKRVSDISAAIQQEIDKHGFGIVRIFAGHGIGKRMHEDPEILNYGSPGQGALLQPGMTLAIEPMLTLGSGQVYIDPDGWTAKSKDHSWAAHVEDTVAVTQHAPWILTR